MTKNHFSLEGKTVAVIGAGSGIGQACAIGAAQQGALVWCLDINADQSNATAKMVKAEGGRAECGVVLESATGESVRQALNLLSNPSFRVTLGHQARFICQEEYHWCKSADQLLSLYRGI